jgi:hypothetical protein
LCLVKLIDNYSMKLVSCKTVNLLSDGSLNIAFKGFLSNKQLLVNEKDNKNFYLNKKKIVKKVHSELSTEYKKKYLI